MHESANYVRALAYILIPLFSLTGFWCNLSAQIVGSSTILKIHAVFLESM